MFEMLVLASAITSAGPPLEETTSSAWDLRLEAGLQTGYAPLLSSDVSIGVLVGAEVSYAVDPALALGMRLAPLGLGLITDDRSVAGSRASEILTLLAWAYVEWRGSWVGVSVGAGGSTVNDREGDQSATGAFMPTLGVRFGAREGLHFSAEAGLHMFEGGVQFGFAQGVFEVPLSPRVGLFLRGIGSNAGVHSGELGVRLGLLRRPRLQQPTLLVTAGYGALFWRAPVVEVFDSQFQSETFIQGPLFGLGFEWGGR